MIHDHISYGFSKNKFTAIRMAIKTKKPSTVSYWAFLND